MGKFKYLSHLHTEPIYWSSANKWLHCGDVWRCGAPWWMTIKWRKTFPLGKNDELWCDSCKLMWKAVNYSIQKGFQRGRGTWTCKGFSWSAFMECCAWQDISIMVCWLRSSAVLFLQDRTVPSVRKQQLSAALYVGIMVSPFGCHRAFQGLTKTTLKVKSASLYKKGAIWKSVPANNQLQKTWNWWTYHTKNDLSLCHYNEIGCCPVLQICQTEE